MNDADGDYVPTFPGVVDELIAVLIGRSDGRVEISDQALAAVKSMSLYRWRDDARHVTVYELRPNPQSGRSRGVTDGV